MYEIKCRADRKLFPPAKEDELGFMVCSYQAVSKEDLPPDAESSAFTATGPLLPYSGSSEITLYGDKWEKRENGYSLSVVAYEEDIPNTIGAITAFLTNLDGCKQAEANCLINSAQGGDVLSWLDSQESFDKAIKNKHNADKVYKAYMLRRTKRDCFFYLLKRLPKNSAKIAADAAFAAADLEEIKTDPFRFAIEGIIPYNAARKIAKEVGISHQSERGVEAAIIDVLLQAEGKTGGSAYGDETVGNTFCTIKELLVKVGNQVGLLKEDSVILSALNHLSEDGFVTCAQGEYIYRKVTSDAEYGIASEVVRLMSGEVEQRDYVDDIYYFENLKHMRLAPEQRKAVKTSLSVPFSLIIGGPGTGKTTIEQFIISVFRRHSKENVLLVAPTGKAARRMSESTGEPANTVHRALNVVAGAEVLTTDTILDAGLILVDEASMLDAQVCFALFKAVKTGTQLILIGDTNQLPSVGVGNVLYELIGSGQVPVTALETVYRQKAGSTIAVNCARIKRGSTSLDYTDDFQFIEADGQEQAADAVIRCYEAEMARGLSTEDICLLSPFRRTTPTGVNQLNPLIQAKVIPPDAEKIQYGQKVFYLNDKVMCMANRENASNGDVGYITAINKGKFEVDYGDERVITYNKNDLRDFDLAYGISIHKSQGCEFKTCIIVMTEEHKPMLKRNLIYTAISRAKSRVLIVGSRNALNTAIETEDVSRRLSRLGQVLQATASATEDSAGPQSP